VALAVARSGGPGDDTLRGTNGPDALSGKGGNDDLVENGISEKFYEKGARGEDYLELTISKAHAHWKSRRSGRGHTYARRKRRSTID
jgi:Ca2+-binding RTX toxin-like protein